MMRRHLMAFPASFVKPDQPDPISHAVLKIIFNAHCDDGANPRERETHDGDHGPITRTATQFASPFLENPGVRHPS
jgi:hypothetical protein